MDTPRTNPQEGSITVDSVSPAAARRLLSGIRVTSIATVKNPADADVIATGISSKTDQLTSALRSQGLTAATVTSVAASVLTSGQAVRDGAVEGTQSALPGGANIATVQWTLISVAIFTGEWSCCFCW